MEKKNAIVILVDSIFSDCISDKRTQTSSTPFIDSLKSNSLFADNVYSFGPYTDAASKGLYCGNRCLDDYGYFFGMGSSEYNIHRVFKENDYETFAYYYPYYYISSKTNQYMDHIVFTCGMVWDAIWFGKYEYYANIIKERELTATEYAVVEKFTDLLFDIWHSFYQILAEKEQAELIVTKIKDTDKAGKDLLEREYHQYLADKKAYIVNLLVNGKEHPFGQINEYDPNRYADPAFLENVYKKNKAFFRKLDLVSLISNLKNNEVDIVAGIKQLMTQGTKKSSLVRWLMCLFAPLMLRERSLKPAWRFGPSFYHQIVTMFKQLDERKETDKPFYFSIHTEDAHQNIAFMSYDMNDESIIAEELEYLKPLVTGCGKKFKGNITYQLALRYTDLCVKRIFEGLKERGLLSSTSVVLMSDHGSSFTGFPNRDIVVNNFHVENYKTPFLIWNPDQQPYNGYYGKKYNANMVLPTICKSFGFEIPGEICQSAIMDMPDGKPYIMTEYMGGGVPDMISREVWISIRNDRYCLAYQSKINEPFNAGAPCCIYDLVNDPLEKKNLAGDVRYLENAEIKELSEAVMKRFEEIQTDTAKLLADLPGLKVTKE